MRILVWITIGLVFGCGGQRRATGTSRAAETPRVDGEGAPTVYVRAEGELDEIAIRTEQYFRITSEKQRSIELAPSPIRATMPYHPVRLPPRFEQPEQKSVELAAPTPAAWNEAVEGVSRSPDSLDAWARLVAATGAGLSSGEVRASWKEVAAGLALDGADPPVVEREQSERGVTIRVAATLRLRQDAPDGLSPAPELTGALRARLDLDREHPLRSRGWAHLDLREPDRTLEWGGGETQTIPGERISMIFAVCFDARGHADYEAECFPEDTPALAEEKPREAAKAYVGDACAPRVARFQETMKQFPWEPYVRAPDYPLPRSTRGRPLPGSYLELDVTDTLAVAHDPDTPVATVLKIEEVARRGTSRRGVRYALRTSPHFTVAKGLHQLVALLEPEDEVVLVVEDPRPRKLEFVPPGATAWLAREVGEILALPSAGEAVGRTAGLGRAIGLCIPLIQMFGELAGMQGDRAAYMDAEIPRGLLACGCEGVDIDALDAYRRLIAVPHPEHRYRAIPLPLTKRPDAPVIRFPEGTTGQALVDRAAELSPAEQKGFRIVFEGRSWKDADWK